MNPTDAISIDEAQIHLLFEDAGLVQTDAIITEPDMLRVDAVIERAMHESMIKDTSSFVFMGFPAAIAGIVSMATGCVGDPETDYRV